MAVAVVRSINTVGEQSHQWNTLHCALQEQRRDSSCAEDFHSKATTKQRDCKEYKAKIKL